MANTVLIADGNGARAEGVLEACMNAGLEARRVETGPEALEVALVEVPQLVVAALELALIDGMRLAEILRANPRTADTRFLFLGRSPARSPSPFDETLPGASTAEEIATQVGAMLERQSRMDAVRRESVARRELNGQLAQLPLVDLVQLLHSNARSGVIELAQEASARERATGAVWLEDGELVHATVGAEVEGAKALFRLLGWGEGRFTFSADRRAPRHSLKGPTRVLLLEGRRQSERIARDASLPSLEAEVRLAVAKQALPQAVHPVTQEVLLLLEMYGRVGDIVEHCGHPDYQVLRTLATLIERGLVDVARGASLDSSQPAGWLEPGAVRRLQAWLEAGQPADQAPRSAKLLLASCDLEATRDFLQLLAPLPGFSAAPQVAAGALAAEDVAQVGTLRFVDGPSIDIIHVPAADPFAPAWPVLAHGALGILLVHTHPVASAEAHLRRLAQRLSQEPGARLFRVLLLRKGDRVAAEDVQARLALLDRSSLFLLPLESGKERVSLLATMLTRVLP